jgi:hypothetical protein
MCEQPNGFSPGALAERFDITRRWATRLLHTLMQEGAVSYFYRKGDGRQSWWEVIDATVEVRETYKNGLHPSQIEALRRATAKRMETADKVYKELPQEALLWWPKPTELLCWTGVHEAIAYAIEASRYVYDVELTSLDAIAA